MIFAIPVFFILIGVELIIAKLQRTQLYRLSDAVSNISCGVTQQVVGVFLKIATLGLYTFIYHQYRIFDFANTWWVYLLLFVAVDFFYYWFHRYAHEISVFWGTHVVHHQSEDYNLSVALRQSAFQVLISSLFYLPLAFLGFEPMTFVLINTIQTLYQFWIHTEVIDRMPAWFEFIFNTPSHHRVHHGRNPKYIDKNHGGTLIIFDRLFGTFQAEEEPVVYGVTKPLNTWSPIWANVDYYKDLAANMQRVDAWGDRLQMLVRRPGWLPESAGGTPPFQEVSREEIQKYDRPLPTWVHIYVLLQFAVVLLGATIFLATVKDNYLQPSMLYMALSVLLSVGSLAALLDARPWGWWLEIFRLVAIPAVGLALL